MKLAQILAVTLLLAPLAVHAAAPAPAAAPPEAALALQDIEKTFGFVPGFLKKFPAVGVAGAWQEMRDIQMNPNTALSGKDKELIGLAVAAQVPCTYCVYAHTEFAKVNGATDDEIAEAVGIAALSRHWSTVINGQQPDDAAFQKWADQALAHGDKMQKAGTPPMAGAVTDAPSTYRDIEANMGSVPDFIRSFPTTGVAAAWKELRAMEFGETALPMKTKSLVGVAVAAQIPCKHCLYLDTKSAKQAGATDKEIGEAIAMAAITRHWSTWLNGARIDQKAFEKDINRIVANVRKAQKAGTRAAMLGRPGGRL